MKQELIQLDDYDLQKEYFTRLSFITKALLNLATKTDNNAEISIAGNMVNDSQFDHIATMYLSKLCHTVDALGMKYLFSGRPEYAVAKKVTISIKDSGFPAISEIITLKNDIDKAEEHILQYQSPCEIRKALVNATLDYRKIPHSLRYDLSQRLYLDMLIKKDLFLPINYPAESYLVESEGIVQCCWHWAVYDVNKHIPNIYVLVFEYSSEDNFQDNDILKKELCDYLVDQSISTLKLITIATDFDKRFKNLHPKMLKRINVGPLYCSNFTVHNSHVQSVLDSMSCSYSDWLLGWTTETLLSKEVTHVNSGFFGYQQKEIFSIDSYNHEAFEAGASEIDKCMIIPYQAFQALVDSGDNPLNEVRKYVVSKQGDITYM